MTMAVERLIDVLPQHRFPVGALANYLSRRLDGFTGELDVRQFQGGQSNPTFLLTTPDGCYVLRKKPPGILLPSAHQIEREYRVQRALRKSGVPVAEMLLLCVDESVIGTSFYIMQHVEGRSFDDLLLPQLTREERRAVYDDLNRIAALLHTVDHHEVGLSDFGRPWRYVHRQIERWTRQYGASRTDDIPAMDRLTKWLWENLPETEEAALVHGDFRIGNLLVHPVEPRVVAVLDWELATVGHPLADIAYTCMPWHVGPMRGSAYSGLLGLDLTEWGLPDERSFVEAYCRRTRRREAGDWRFFLAFSFFRSAAIAQGVYARALQGNAADRNAATVRTTVYTMAETGWQIASR